MPFPSTARSENRHVVYGMNGQLALEDEHKALVDLLFLGCTVRDISSSKDDRKSGTDFWLRPPGCEHDGFRCENKFEQLASGRQNLEIVSVDRPRLVPGWMFTSRTAWLLSWYPSAELVAVPMADVRALMLDDPARFKTTTTANRTYLTWNALYDLKFVVSSLARARVLDLEYELGLKPGKPRMLRGVAPQKHCVAEDLVELIAAGETESTPVPVTDERLQELMRTMAPKNFRATEHAQRIAQLPFMCLR